MKNHLQENRIYQSIEARLKQDLNFSGIFDVQIYQVQLHDKNSQHILVNFLKGNNWYHSADLEINPSFTEDELFSKLRKTLLGYSKKIDSEHAVKEVIKKK